VKRQENFKAEKSFVFCHYLKILIMDIAWFDLTMVIYM